MEAGHIFDPITQSMGETIFQIEGYHLYHSIQIKSKDDILNRELDGSDSGAAPAGPWDAVSQSCGTAAESIN